MSSEDYVTVAEFVEDFLDPSKCIYRNEYLNAQAEVSLPKKKKAEAVRLWTTNYRIEAKEAIDRCTRRLVHKIAVDLSRMPARE